jgi:PAS domain S-box-containing protein
LHFDPERPERYYGLLVTADYKDVVAHSTQVRNETIVFGSLLMMGTLWVVLVVSRKLTQPLREITKAVVDFGQGVKQVKLPIEAGDEAGVLARAFGQMIHQVRRHGAQLEAEIAERGRTETALRESEHHLRLALGAAKAGVWEWDLRTGQTVWDKSIESMAPFDPDTFSANIDSWLEHMHPEDVGNIPEAKRRAVEENRPYEVEFRIHSRDGSWRHWSARGDLVRAEDGRPLKLVGVAWDITEAKLHAFELEQLNRKLQEQNRDLDEFNHMVSHDLREPIRHLLVFGQRLREYHSERLPQKAARDLLQIREAAQRMENSIGGLQLLSQTSRRDMNRTSVPLESCARAALADFEELIVQKQATFSCDPLPVVVADPALLALLFRQLISNSLKYCHEKPRIQFTADRVGSEWVCGVRDNGIGIDLRYAERIFKAFQRLHGRNEYGGGTGLGLAICRKVVERHGGRIWVEPNTASGSHFRFTLSADVTADTPTAAASPSSVLV